MTVCVFPNRTKSKYVCRGAVSFLLASFFGSFATEGLTILSRFPLRDVADRPDNVSQNLHGAGSSSQANLLLCTDRTDFGDRLSEACDEDRLASLADFFENRQAGGFELRDRDFLHDRTPSRVG